MYRVGAVNRPSPSISGLHVCQRLALPSRRQRSLRCPQRALSKVDGGGKKRLHFMPAAYIGKAPGHSIECGPFFLEKWTPGGAESTHDISLHDSPGSAWHGSQRHKEAGTLSILSLSTLEGFKMKRAQSMSLQKGHVTIRKRHGSKQSSKCP